MVAPSSRSPGAGAPVVLNLEDQPTVRRALCEALARAGLDVEAASDAVAALALCRVRPVDVAVLPSPSGPRGDDLLPRLRTLRPDVRAVFVAETPTEAPPSVPGAECLLKPFTSEDLIHAVMRQLR